LRESAYRRGERVTRDSAGGVTLGRHRGAARCPAAWRPVHRHASRSGRRQGCVSGRRRQLRDSGCAHRRGPAAAGGDGGGTLETARIVFGRSATVADALQKPVTPERTAALVALLATPAAAGSNVVLVSHREIIKAALGIDPALGEAFIVRPDGAGRFTILARLTMDGWKILG
jgi:hypothetical protein